MKTKVRKTIEDFKRMAAGEDGIAFISPLGMLSVHAEDGKWLVEDTGRAPDPVVGEYDSIDDLLANFKRDGKSIADVLQEADILVE